jgi:hypothetical protein
MCSTRTYYACYRSICNLTVCEIERTNTNMHNCRIRSCCLLACLLAVITMSVSALSVCRCGRRLLRCGYLLCAPLWEGREGKNQIAVELVATELVLGGECVPASVLTANLLLLLLLEREYRTLSLLIRGMMVISLGCLS